MINERNVKGFCCEDISLIENYDKAIADNTQTWEPHHRLETDKNLSVKELKSMKMYYHRPASELIFLTPFEHKSLHHKGKTPWNKGIPAWNKGISPTEETRKKISIKLLGNKATTGHKWVHNNKEIKMVKQEELYKYLKQGYKLGRKIK